MDNDSNSENNSDSSEQRRLESEERRFEYEERRLESYYKEASDAMMCAPVSQIPTEFLQRFATDTYKACRDPEGADLLDPGNNSAMYRWIERHDELVEELTKRGESFNPPLFAEDSSGYSQPNPKYSEPNSENSEPSSSKRKREDDEPKQEPKRFKQDSSDVDAACEMPDVCGEDDC